MPRRSSTACRLLALLAETSVHAGTGAQLGVVDLPIQRERHTEWPTVYGSGLKGVFRDHAGSVLQESAIFAIFGPETDKGGQGEESRYAGALAVSDARLLLFPVRAAGVAFAWVTCPLALARLARDAAEVGLPPVPPLEPQPTTDKVVIPPGWPNANAGVLLEEFRFEAVASPRLTEIGKWMADYLFPVPGPYAYWREAAAKALSVVSDDDFRDFVRHGTEVVTRVKLSAESKTVEQKALWTEENLPADTLLYSLVTAWRPAVPVDPSLVTAEDVVTRFARVLDGSGVIQVGGKETVGRGFVAARLAGGSHA